MILPFSISLIAVLTVAASGLPQSQALNVKRTSSVPQSNISASVLDHAGQDITSSFEIRAYHEPKAVVESNLTNRQTPLSRAVTLCPIPDSTFLRSYCDPETFRAGTLQRYTIVCKRERVDPWTQAAARFGFGTIVTTGSTAPARPSIEERAGYCQYNEICVTTSRYTTEANCVKATYFQRIMASWNGAQSAIEIVNTMAQADVRNALQFGLGGTIASVIVSDVNGTTPVEVDALNIKAGVNGQIGLGGDQTTQCRDCVDLATHKLKPNTDLLKTEARLLTTGTAAGIMWLAFMSG